MPRSGQRRRCSRRHQRTYHHTCREPPHGAPPCGFPIVLYARDLNAVRVHMSASADAYGSPGPTPRPANDAPPHRSKLSGGGRTRATSTERARRTVRITRLSPASATFDWTALVTRPVGQCGPDTRPFSLTRACPRGERSTTLGCGAGTRCCRLPCQPRFADAVETFQNVGTRRMGVGISIEHIESDHLVEVAQASLRTGGVGDRDTTPDRHRRTWLEPQQPVVQSDQRRPISCRERGRPRVFGGDERLEADRSDPIVSRQSGQPTEAGVDQGSIPGRAVHVGEQHLVARRPAIGLIGRFDESSRLPAHR